MSSLFHFVPPTPLTLPTHSKLHPFISRRRPPPKLSLPSASADPTFRPSAPHSSPFPSLFATIDGISIHHTLSPPTVTPSTPLIICVHGFGASLFSFSFLALPLPLLAFDLPSFGLSSRPNNLRYYSPHFAQRIIHTLSSSYSPQLPFVLLAHSLGALSAVRAALATPNRLSALILVAPALLPSSKFPHLLRILARAVASILATSAVGISYLLAPILVFLLRKVVGSKGFWRMALAMTRECAVSEEVLDGYFKPTLAKNWEAGFLNFCRAALKDRARALGRGEDFVTMLARLPVEECPPVLIIHGDSDRVVPIGNSKMLVERLGGRGEMVVMEGVGHVPHEEKSVEFSAIVKGFLERVALWKGLEGV